MARILNEKKDGFPIPKDNYKMILIGFGIVIVGFLLMMGGGADSPDTLTMTFLVSAGLHWRLLWCYLVLVSFSGESCGNPKRRGRRKIKY